mgnify:CR=1 FL=1
MNICKIESHEVPDGHRIQALISEEGPGRGREFYVETNLPVELSEAANGFLLASYLPAMDRGERELTIEGEVCPKLVSNLSLVASIMQGWFRKTGEPPEVIGSLRKSVPSAGVGIFLSGGVDSMYSLMELTERLPLGHPLRPTFAVLIDYREASLSDAQAHSRFDESFQRCQRIADSVGIELAWVRTNLRALRLGGDFWTRRYHGAMLASIAHFLSGTGGRFYIASSSSKGADVPWGSHPMLDPLYSSCRMEICHHGVELSKFDKIGELVKANEMIQHLQVCTAKTDTGTNCGRCKKCLRTKLYLAVNGADWALSAFDYESISREDICSIPIKRDQMYGIYCYLLENMRKRGSVDPVWIDELDRKLKKYKRWRFLRSGN